MSAIGYKNLFTDPDATVTVSTEAAGFEKENAYDYKQYDWWKPTATGYSWIKVAFATAQTVDYFAIWGHNLFGNSTYFTFQYSDDDVTWTTKAGGAPTDNETIYRETPSSSHKYWRIIITSATPSTAIAGVQIGETTTLETGLATGLAIPAISPIVESKTAMSELGVNLGATVKRTGVKGSIQMSNLSPEWVRSDLQPLIAHLNNGYPAVFAWDPDNYPDETLLIWKSADIPAPTYSTPLYMSASIPFEGTL